MRRIRLNWVYRLNRGVRPALKSFVGFVVGCEIIVGLFGGVDVTFDVEVLYYIVGSGAVVGLIVLWWKSRSEHLPDIVTDEDNDDGLYDVTLCDSETLREANALTKPYYHHEYVSDDVAERWREMNPKGFVAIRNKEQKLCAAFGVLAVEESFFGQFIKGRVLDNQLEAGDVLNFDGSKKSSKLYISGVVVRDADGPQGSRRACVMVWVMLDYLRKMYGTRRRRTVYALAVSKRSENLLRRFGFRVECRRSRRRDGLNLYSLSLNSNEMRRVEERIGDRSSSVRSSSFDPPAA